mmetsp:Transcript_28304/g.42773  ORF Transcript_28304/g.42773 Transcript_28304/m.42773 type:complete len:109 (-) Transcript_28304:119-445(-)|eukprot:CAMPEP_0206470072 /NCGR_PEP_ID=MMETSP0324_2-20121206/30693_1 /ASSEMBLY_ACC=CAM_ASM_000836 /TAXON_ID=2866 /ORGANISM="Crypthecodinium cohnii, Strain Seligo" /LENGTH=108 /DNA_ID=CAMNT_0053944023 /DNA_START=88 /DNA_END=414 /DNA_ORIENTATION=+
MARAPSGSMDASTEAHELNKLLVETGERARLKEYVMATLKECGWQEDLKKHCVEVIQKKGVEKITMEEITAEIAPKGRAMVPDSLKVDLLNRLRGFAEEQGLESQVKS